ncbi:hypothetical protein [Synechococcus sp. M16CYN]|uniref:hypothetical protein n=1 Tax=Synechococcus sp. M16CYN TaxID=3103139 RepID=UPI00333FB493
MMLIQRILLISSLLPLLVVLGISTVQRGQVTRIHLLTWSSPSLPLGVWTAIGAVSGAGLAASTTLFVLPLTSTTLRRMLYQPYTATPAVQDQEVLIQDSFSSGLQRDPRDPAPTIATPYRVIQRGKTRSENTASANKTVSLGDDRKPTSVSARWPSNSGWGNDPNRDW